MQKIITVDDNDNFLKFEEKIQVHKDGLLHRAFSVFIFFEDCLLLQKRAKKKYHFGGLWSNTCCSHPVLQDKNLIENEAKERLNFEMNLDLRNTNLDFLTKITYNAKCKETKLIENEIDYIFYKKLPKMIIKIEPNKEEVDDFFWIRKDELQKDLEINSKKYTPWLSIIIKESNILNLV